MYLNRLSRIACAAITLAFLLPLPVQADITDNPPPGFSVIALFTGVRTTADVSVSAHCSNLDKNKTAGIIVEFFDFNGDLEGTGSASLAPGGTHYWRRYCFLF